MAIEVDPHHEDDDETALARRLNVIWINEYENSRYVPKAIGEGPGWEVWDQKEKRSLSADEVRVLTYEEVTESYTN